MSKKCKINALRTRTFACLGQRYRVRWNETKDVFLQTLAEVQQVEENNRTALMQNYALWYNPEDLPQEEW